MKITCSEICWSAGKRPILDRVSLTTATGQFTGIIGPNGSGKSSLLRCLYRALTPDSGQMFLNDREIRSFSRRELAVHMAAVLQESLAECPFTVMEMVMMGRYPHHSTFSSLNREDRAKAQYALEQADLLTMEQAMFQSLSGGEKQRVMIARALCQETPVLLLDEPTNHLDIRHALALLGLIKKLQVTTLAVLHDLNLAAACCDKIVVLEKGRVTASGEPGAVFTPSLLKVVFGVEAEVNFAAEGPYIRFLGPSRED
ncbi:MAG: ABC transporter ATP-binding protein [Candidatus Electrothrix sp. AW1]|nr:ABC transporter ATP-binding protein [Candidatus Electrothrix sp. AX1]MCI5182924.1 ABC transporter ATP-binding protein [Candidatus Electrothrix gigas]